MRYEEISFEVIKLCGIDIITTSDGDAPTDIEGGDTPAIPALPKN